MILTAIPILDGPNASSFTVDTQEWTSTTTSSSSSSSPSPSKLVELLDTYKALVFRRRDKNNDEEPLTVEEFGQFVVDQKFTHYPYVGGAAPRRIIPVPAGQDIVFTANESPPDQPIPFHHELAQTPNPPAYIFFYAHVPAESGGETPLIDSTAVYRYVAEHYHDEFLTKLVAHGARYTRTLPAQDDPTSPIGRSYQNTWQVSTRQELDAKLTARGDMRWTWLDDGSVRITTEAVPGIRLVKESHPGIVPNFVYQYTFANSIVAAYLGWQDVRNDRFQALTFGNGDPMPNDVLEDIAKFMQEHRIVVPWQKGDIMALNNQLVMHSRNPFQGPRRVLASIWGPPSQPLPSVTENGKSIGAIDTNQYLNHLKTVSDPLVFGFWKVDKENCADVCYQAIQAGYRRLDCACDYGNEEQVGQGIARALQDGLCTREELFVTSKLWNTFHHPDHVPLGLEKTLKDLQLDYLDEYLIHFPISMEFVPIEDKYPPEWTNMDGKMVLVPQDLGATWKAMEALVDAGKCKRIGVCNFSTQHLRQLLSTCRIRPATLQVELHPHNAQSKLIRFCREAGMRVTAFSVLGATSYKILGGATDDDELLTDKTILELAASKRKTPAQILIRWALQRHTLPLVKTSTPSRMTENRQVFDFYLTAAEMERINALNQNKRYNDPGVFCEAAFGTFCPIYE